MPPDRQPLSAVLIALNAASQLPGCLDSLAFCDEIVIVDSGSTDATIEIAHKAGARVIHQDWLGYGPQKRFAVERAAHDWVLCLDADERVSDRLRESILVVLGSPAFSAYRFPRRNRFLGRWLRHGEGYPDWSLRLFDRRHARWSGDAVHEKVVADGEVGDLRGDLLHDSAETLEDYLAKQDRYTTLAAQAALAAGRRATILHPLLSPLIRFIKFYFLRLGFLDGWPGMVHILIGCRNSHAKYAKMLRKQSAGGG
ncbi:MAG: glycosyltransferase family 2 protein [Candidatus Nitricoxidivorans perseverans]|uniref:Glycosyltransferase family 2 protein n=1 Tax=Candidatus Nitricoxidivorans perseverans TaxID=2975601 RepID=A0AA49IY50_9PROT|nr:MAG: glycosyltransferase family 2 protein [Candidatus Nitricoxidivorans perseverans]